MKRQFEESFLDMILFDVREISNKENSTITKNYYDCYNYLSEIIDALANTASDWLMVELSIQKQYYKYRYLYYKGLI